MENESKMNYPVGKLLTREYNDIERMNKYKWLYDTETWEGGE
jgi:hypothetical protein